jgi:hypothetical protein
MSLVTMLVHTSCQWTVIIHTFLVRQHRHVLHLMLPLPRWDKRSLWCRLEVRDRRLLSVVTGEGY